MKRATALDNLYHGHTAWVVGRGPSLARLNAAHIGEGPVIAINQAIEAVEKLELPNPLYSMQKDKFFVSTTAVILAHEHESAKDNTDEMERLGAYVFDCEADYGYPWSVPSVVACAGLAYRMGCQEVIYLCCDAATDGITEAYGYPATQPQAYLMHKLLVMRHARIPVTWRKIQ